MKLTGREMAIFSAYSATRRRRKIGAWISLAAVIAFWVAMAYIDKLESVGTVLGISLGLIIAELVSLHFRTRPEDKLIDLLQRYINEDAEALEQFSSSHR